MIWRGAFRSNADNQDGHSSPRRRSHDCPDAPRRRERNSQQKDQQDDDGRSHFAPLLGTMRVCLSGMQRTPLERDKDAAPANRGGPFKCHPSGSAMPCALPSLSNARGRVATLRMPPYLLGLIVLHPVLHRLALIRCHVEPLCAGDGRVAVRPLPPVIAKDGAAITLSKGRTGGEGRDCGCKNDRFHGYSPRCWQATCAAIECQ